MKYVKAINLQTEGQSRKYQKGQTAKDKFNNLYVFNRVISDDEVRDLYQTMKVHMGMS